MPIPFPVSLSMPSEKNKIFVLLLPEGEKSKKISISMVKSPESVTGIDIRELPVPSVSNCNSLLSLIVKSATSPSQADKSPSKFSTTWVLPIQ